MQLTPEQVKGRIKNVAKENKADARTLMRIYMMERFLERVASSQYKDNFIIKGGMLVTAMVAPLFEGAFQNIATILGVVLDLPKNSSWVRRWMQKSMRSCR